MSQVTHHAANVALFPGAARTGAHDHDQNVPAGPSLQGRHRAISALP